MLKYAVLVVQLLKWVRSLSGALGADVRGAVEEAAWARRRLDAGDQPGTSIGEWRMFGSRHYVGRAGQATSSSRRALPEPGQGTSTSATFTWGRESVHEDPPLLVGIEAIGPENNRASTA